MHSNARRWRRLLERRPIDRIERELAADAERPLLRRVLGPVDLALMGIGVTVGAGIFVVTGTAAALYAGPAITLSFLLAAAACALSAMCYAELAAMIPAAGSAYTYAYATLGELIAWIVGWNLVLEYLFAASYVAVGWSGYFVSFLGHWGLHLPVQLVTGPFGPGAAKTAAALPSINLPAIAITLALAWVALSGISVSRTVNAIIVSLKLGVLLLVIIVGAPHIDPRLWSPFVPPSTGEHAFGWAGILRGAGVVFVSYLGFDAIATTAQETRNPQRSLPLAILGTLAIATLLYIVVSLVLTGLISYRALNVPNPLSVALRATGAHLAWLVALVDAAALVGLGSVILVVMLAQPRILFAMSRDGLLPEWFGQIHEKTRVPAKSTLLSATVIAVLAGCFPIGILVQLVSIGTLGIFIAVCAGVIVLRRTRPLHPRPFRSPWVPLLPLLGMAVCGYILTGLPALVWYLYGAWILSGLALYGGYGQRRARVIRERAT